MGRPDRLPGVSGPEETGPHPVYNPSRDFHAARKRAAVRDLIDLAALIAVDIFFLSWPSARIPFLSRDGSLWVLLLLHLVVVASWVRTRLYLPWRARRIAGTWSEKERRQFQNRKQRAESRKQ